jgi:hypothetical protein
MNLIPFLSMSEYIFSHQLLADYDAGEINALFDPFFAYMHRTFQCTRIEVMELFEMALENTITYARFESETECPSVAGVTNHMRRALFDVGDAVWRSCVEGLRKEKQ